MLRSTRANEALARLLQYLAQMSLMRSDDDEAPTRRFRTFQVETRRDAILSMAPPLPFLPLVESIRPEQLSIAIHNGLTTYYYNATPGVYQYIPTDMAERIMQSSSVIVNPPVIHPPTYPGRSIATQRQDRLRQIIFTRERREVQRAMAEARAAESAGPQREYTLTYSRQFYGASEASSPPPMRAIVARDQDPPGVPRAERQATATREAPFRQLHATRRSPLAIGSVASHPEHDSQEDNTFQRVLDARCTRIKAPIKQFMALADEVQDDVSNGVYLKMANTAKEMYEIVEELYPTTVEGYHANTQANDEVAYMQARIAELESQVVAQEKKLEEVYREKATICEEHIQNEETIKRCLKNLEALYEREKANEQLLQVHKDFAKQQTENHIVKPHVAHLKMVNQMSRIIERSEYVKRITVGNPWDIFDYNMRVLHPQPWVSRHDNYGNRWIEIETTSYDKNEYTEGFGALGFSLDDEVSLWEMWSSNAE